MKMLLVLSLIISSSIALAGSSTTKKVPVKKARQEQSHERKRGSTQKNQKNVKPHLEKEKTKV